MMSVDLHLTLVRSQKHKVLNSVTKFGRMGIVKSVGVSSKEVLLMA